MNLGRRGMSLVLAGVMLAPVLPGCTSKPVRQVASSPSAAPPPTLAITPAPAAKEVPISAEIGVTVLGGRVTEVVLTDERGASVSGELRPEGDSWLPDRALAPRRTYTAQVTAENDSGQAVTQSTTFTTMAKPSKTITSTLYFENGRTYGVAMPITVAFEPAVPKQARADVQRRLLVRSDPPQPGAWRWAENGRQIEYRPRDFWQPGGTVTIRSALAGLPIAGRYGDADQTATAEIGKRVFLDIDNKTKQMSVYRDDKLLRRIPVSLGKPSTPSSSGKMVIMEKTEATVFDTRGEPNGGYVVPVEDAQRLTWGGEFIHGAPWSEGDQGRVNVSHGCANISARNADWLMGITQVGDLVTVSGTEVQLQEGNGWTAWNMSWEEFIKGSALPVPPEVSSAPTGGTGTPTSPPSGAGPTAPSPPASVDPSVPLPTATGG